MTEAERQLDWMAEATTPAKLDPRLAKFLMSGGPMTDHMIHHPLMVEIMYVPEWNNMYNLRYEAKREAYRECRHRRKWGRCLMWIERPYRIEMFAHWQRYMCDTEYWSNLSWLWTDSENIWQNQKLWLRFLRARGRSIEYRPFMFMDDDERHELMMFPETITIWRGAKLDCNEHGMSWTIDRERAEWFANRLLHTSQTPVVITGEVKKENVIALLNGRGEREIVCLPEHVRVRGGEVC